MNESTSITALHAQMNLINGQLAAERRNRIASAVDNLIAENRVTAPERDRVLARAVTDETYLDELRMRTPATPGSVIVDSASVFTKNDSVRNALKEIEANDGKGGQQSYDTAPYRSRRISEVYNEARPKILEVLNAAANNSVATGLKRQVVLQETVRDFALRVLPLRMFSSTFLDVPLQGNNIVDVPYYPLQTAASSNFTDGDGTGGTGYQFGQATTTGSFPITVATRKYQPIDYSSNDFRRQPFFDAVKLGKINAEKLGYDILIDCLSAFTLANYPTIPQIDPNFTPNLALPASAYTSDNIVDLMTVGDNLNWPETGRALIVNSTLKNALAKDPTYKLALNIGTSTVTQDGKFPNLSGFDFAWMPVNNFPTNGISLQGLIAFASALGVVFSPIAPADGVRKQLVGYEIATDLATGIGLNYRHWGLAQADRDFEVIESAYGYAPIIAKAAQLLT